MTPEYWALREVSKFVRFDEDHVLHIGTRPMHLAQALSEHELQDLKQQIADEMMKAYKAGTDDTVAAALA